MAASQTANTWSDLRDLLNAGVSVESALGLEEDSQGKPIRLSCSLLSSC